MEEVYLSNKTTGISHNPTTEEKQTEIIDKLEDIRVLVTLPQDLSITASPTFAGTTLSDLTPSRLVFTNIEKSFASGVTDITAAQLEELSDGSETTLHSHAVGDTGHTFVHRDLPTTVDFVSTYNEGGTITSQQDFHCIDSAAGFVAAGIRVGAWVNNWTDSTWAQVVTINSETNLTLDTNIFPNNDGDGYNTYFLRQAAWYDLDLSSIVDSGAVLILLYVQLNTDSTTPYIFFRKNGVASTLEINGIRQSVANISTYRNILVACDANRIIEYKLQDQDRACNIVIGGWWK